ncbi:MAG: hypothetical protein HRT38_09805 [Alteromonadaceae bacterium]|nr:hypothetical protein [Alteromonadaceae bacterium]
MLELHPDTLARLKEDHHRAVLIKLDLIPEAVYLTNFATDISYKGNSYLSNGQLLGFGNLKQTIDIRVSSSTLILDAVDPSLVALFLGRAQQGRDVDIFLAILNQDYSIAGTPIAMGAMIIDGAPSITDDPTKGKAIIKQKISSEFANWKQKGGIRTTPASLQRFAPGDTGFDFAAESGKEYKWGSK